MFLNWYEFFLLVTSNTERSASIPIFLSLSFRALLHHSTWKIQNKPTFNHHLLVYDHFISICSSQIWQVCHLIGLLVFLRSAVFYRIAVPCDGRLTQDSARSLCQSMPHLPPHILHNACFKQRKVSFILCTNLRATLFSADVSIFENANMKKSSPWNWYDEYGAR